MKKLFSLILAIVMVLSLSVAAFASTDGTTTLTTEVPDNTPTWTLTVPASATIPYGTTEYVYLGQIEVSHNEGRPFYVQITQTYDPFSDGNGHEISYYLIIGSTYSPSGEVWGVLCRSIYTLPVKVYVDQSAWDAAANYPGTYTSVVTFTSWFNGWEE